MGRQGGFANVCIEYDLNGIPPATQHLRHGLERLRQLLEERPRQQPATAALHHVYPREEGVRGLRCLLKGRQIARRRGLLHSRELQPAQHFRTALAQLFSDAAAGAFIGSVQYRSRQAQPRGERPLDKSAGRRGEQEIHDHRDTGRNGDEEPYIQHGAGCEFTRLKRRDDVKPVAHDQHDDSGQGTQLAGEGDRQEADRERAHNGDTEERRIDDQHGEKHQKPNNDSDQNRQRHIQNQTLDAVWFVKKEGRIGGQGGIGCLIDFTDERGQRTDQGESRGEA